MDGDQGAIVNRVNWDSDDDNEGFTPRSLPLGWNPGKPPPPPRFSRGLSSETLPEDKNVASTNRDEHVPWFRRVYGIPESVKLCPPHRSQLVDWKFPKSKAVAFYKLWFDIGLRLPLPWFLIEVLTYLRVAPSQLMPNALRLILGLQTISETRGIKIGVDTLMHSYFVKEMPKEKGRIMLALRSGYEQLVVTPTTSDNSSWKDVYLFVKTNYVFGSDRNLRILVHWQPFEGIKSDPDLEAQSAEEILKLPFQDRKSCVLLTPRVLETTSIWWTAIMETGGCPESYSERVDESSSIRNSHDMLLEFRKEREKKKRLADSQKQIMSPETILEEEPLRMKRRKKGHSTSAFEGFATTVELGVDASVRVNDSSYFEGKRFDLDGISSISHGGVRGAASYVLGENIKALHGSIFLAERVESLEDECDGLKKENGELKKLVSAAEERATDALAKKEKAEGLMRQTIHKSEKCVIETRRDIFKQLLEGVEFDYAEEVCDCDELLQAKAARS